MARSTLDEVKLGETAGALRTSHGDIAAQMKQVRTSIDALFGDWQNRAKDKFDIYFQHYEKGINEAMIGLTDMATWMDNYARANAEADEAAANSIPSA